MQRALNEALSLFILVVERHVIQSLNKRSSLHI